MITVTAPARLHLGFLDLNGGLGRRFGSIGLTIAGFATCIRLERASATGIAGVGELDRAGAILDQLAAAWSTPPVRAQILEVIPPHAGLGSGTQLGLALGVGLARLFGRTEGPREVAGILERGSRSGIGIGAFAQGGLLLDGGKGSGDEPPPIIARLAFPDTWRLVLILDEARRGLSGPAERAAFAALPPFPAEAAAQLCRLALMRLLPGIMERDLAAVGRAITEIQERVGDHFAPAQGGRYASSAVAEALDWCRRQGVAGLGQSSWGPTGFALLPDQVTAERLRDEAARAFPGLRFVVVAARNEGALVKAG